MTDDVAGHHVLIIDDTWASGSHVQSLAAAVREAGAAEVSILCIARFVNPSFEPTRPRATFLQKPGAGTDPSLCPWTTNGTCP